MEAPPEKSPLAKLRHDLRTPINHILGYGELLEEDLTDQGITKLEDLGKIKNAARTLLELIATGLSDEALGNVNLRERVARPVSTTAPEAGDSEGADHLPKITGRILVVDDNQENRETLARRLKRQGHETAEATDGRHALELLAKDQFDLVLLDVMMPEIDGHEALRRMKSDESLKHIPVIMISALDEIESVVRCIEAGAEDYLPKPFNPTVLRARIGASLEKKSLRDQEQAYLNQIEETQRRLEDELQEAARYVASILPPPETKPFPISWNYLPSTELGGDSFGYHWIDDTHFAIYLLDVCGHGVGAALLSVAAINVLRSSAMPGTDFCDPSQVLASLNENFQMERHNNMYFTIWYGVYDTASGTLRHASGGHPPAILLKPTPHGDETELLRAPGMIIGAMPGLTFDSETTVVPPGSRLFVYCDGAYEVKRADDSMLDFDEEFVPFLRKNGRSPTITDDLLAWIRSVNTAPALDDDFSIIAMDFPPREP